MVNPIRVVLADDDAAVRSALRSFLGTVPGISVIAEAEDGRAAVWLALLHQPDIMLMDISMPKLNGLDATRQIGVVAPGVRVLVVTAHRSHVYMERALLAGARGFLVKAGIPTELAEAIDAALRDRPFISAHVDRPARMLSQPACASPRSASEPHSSSCPSSPEAANDTSRSSDH